MEGWIKEIKKHLFIYWLFIKNSLMGQLEFRFNFVAGIIVECGFLIAKLLYVLVVYRTGVVIHGLSPDAVLMFVGSYTLMTGIYVSLFMINNYQFSEHVRNGTLDLILTKPISTQFMLTVRHIEIGMPIPNMIGGLIMISISWQKLGVLFDLEHVLLFAGYTISGVLLMYSLLFLPQLLSFRFVNTHAITELGHAIWDFNNMPSGIYNKVVQRLGVFVLPIFLITNFSPLAVLGKLSTVEMLWGLLAPILFFLITRILWKSAIRRYSSASS